MNERYREFLIKRYDTPKDIPATYKYQEDKKIDIPVNIKDMIVTYENCRSLLLLDSKKEFYVYYPFEKESKLEKIQIPAGEDPLVFTSRSRKSLFAYTSETLALIYGNSIRFFKKGQVDVWNTANFGRIPKKIMARYGKFYILFANGTSQARDSNGEVLKNEPIDNSIFEDKEKPDLDGNVDIFSFGYNCLDDLWVLTTNKKLRYYEKTAYYENEEDLDKIIFPQSADTVTDEYTTWSDLHIDCDIPDETGIVVEVDVDGNEKNIFYTPDILLYGYKGEKLNINIKLKSNDDNTLTPTINSIKVTINQKPYIDYLPAYYHRDKEILSRYLSIFQNIMDGLEEKIEKSHELLDPMLCAEEYLEWLSLLLGIARDYRWSEDSWRAFLAEAPALYAGLGTKRSMKRAIELYCNEKPEIKDDYNDINKLWTFCVTLKPDKIKDQRDIDVIESIIETFKPAHTNGRLLIGYKKEAFIVGKSSLAIDTQIK